MANLYNVDAGRQVAHLNRCGTVDHADLCLFCSVQAVDHGSGGITTPRKSQFLTDGRHQGQPFVVQRSHRCVDTQNIIFGLPNSGLVVPFSIFKLDAASASSSFAYDPGFGVEGTIVAVGIQAVAIIILIIWGEKRGKKEYDVWAQQ